MNRIHSCLLLRLCCVCCLFYQEQYLIPELPYATASNVDVILECFADISGDLLYDDDLLVGRTLTDHDMFFIKDLQTEEIVIHILNADDYFIGAPDKMNLPFEEPLLKVKPRARKNTRKDTHPTQTFPLPLYRAICIYISMTS